MVRTEALAVYAEEWKKRGFKKKGNLWYKDCGKITLMFHAQHSNFDRDNYYINLGAAVTPFLKGKPPKLTDWFLTFRLQTHDFSADGLGETPEERIKNAAALSPAEHAALTASIMQPDPYLAIEKAEGYFAQMDTPEKLVRFVRESEEGRYFCHETLLRRLAEQLGMPPETWLTGEEKEGAAYAPDHPAE